MTKKESKSKSKSKSKTKSNKGSRGSVEELKMIKSPLTEAFNNKELIEKNIGGTIRNFRF